MKWYVLTGENRVEVEADSAREALAEAMEIIVSDESKRPLSALTIASRHGFDSQEDDDFVMGTVALLRSIGVTVDVKH